MKLGLKTIVLTLVVALLCVPAAFAKGPGGHGQGKPSWAGGGGGNGHGKPAWAGLGKGHADKAKAKHEKKHQRAEVQASELQLDLADLNPAWQCFMVESMMDEEDVDAGGVEPGEFSSFDAKFGTNDNKRNSHGMCVSAAAHGDDVGAALADDEAESCDEPADDSSEEPAVEEGTDDSTVEEGTDDPAADDPADDGSDEQAGEADECESDDTASEDDQAGEDDQGEETEVAAFARALVRFIKL